MLSITPWIRPVLRWWVANDSMVRQGHVYSNIVASDSSRVHNGDNYNTQVVHYHSYEIPQGSTSTKRKRPVSDAGDGPRSINHEVLEKAVQSLPTFQEA
jgi:hypothetical protein